MKKMMMTMVAMGFAISAQAAAVTWTTDIFQDRNGTTYAMNATIAFTTTVVFYEWNALANEGAGDWVVFAAGGQLGGSKLAITRDFRGKATGFLEDTKYMVHLSISSHNEPDWFVSQNLVFTTDPTGDTTISLAPLVWQQIPEPATMALLGIGIVAVGLRRRRK